MLFLLEQNIEKIGLIWKSKAIGLLEKNLNKLIGLSGNPNAISLLEQNLDRVDWNGLLLNPNAISKI